MTHRDYLLLLGIAKPDTIVHMKISIVLYYQVVLKCAQISYQEVYLYAKEEQHLLFKSFAPQEAIVHRNHQILLLVPLEHIQT